MNDLDIIKQIENELGIHLKKLDKEDWISKGYILNQKEQVIDLSLWNYNIKYLKKVESLLKKLKVLTILDLSSNELRDVSFLKEFKGLTNLNLCVNELSDVSFLKELKGLTNLGLRTNNLSDVSFLKELKGLTYLDLGFNNLSDVSFLKELKGLKYLNISHNGQVKDFSFLRELKGLKNLELSYNGQVKDFSFLRELKGLKNLNLNSNNLIDVSFLKELKGLTNLELSFNKIKDVSFLKELKNLKELDLNGNNLNNVSFLKELKGLTNLDLSFNKIRDVSFLKELKGLTNLNLSSNSLSDISFLKELKGLTNLNLNSTNLSDVSFLKELKGLTNLNLSINKIKDVSPLKGLRNLSSLYIAKNKIKELPEWITDFKMDIAYTDAFFDGINLYDNPLIKPPVSTVKQGKKAIIRYFEKIKEEGIDYIYESKLTLVGEGAAGKTSLKIRLMDAKGKLPKEYKRIRGIKIYDWNFKREKGKNHIAHIWDFGGQDVYYPVHRFFLTENSVYVLLASTRQNQHNFDYWIPTIYQFGGISPIILGQTCHDRNKFTWNDIDYYIGNTNFNIIRTQKLPYYEIDLPNKNEGLRTIKRTIIEQILNLPRYGKGVPKSWVTVRDLINRMSKRNDCISFDKFKEICRKISSSGFADLVDIEDCAKFLHSIGAILWYSEHDELKNCIILKPEWAVNAVYKIIDDATILKRRGNILVRDFNRLWKKACYKEKHSVLKKMLEVFKIAFPKKHKKGEYIIPARLQSIPNKSRWKNDEPYLRLEYEFEFMPKGMVNQLSADLSRFITSENEVWNNAVNFKFENNKTQCQVEEDFFNRKISIKAKGKDARGLIILIMNSLKDISEEYKGVKPEIYVPCTCDICENSSKPTTFLYDNLLRWSKDKEGAGVTCNESGENMRIDELLYNVGLPNPSKDVNEKPINKTIKIFLASSSELEKDREQFEIFINRENKRLNKEGVFLQLELWEDFIDAMSKTGLQDEYNKTIKGCDIFVSLFFTKVGKYTEEEFETAFGQFKKTGRPLVYTYFKDAKIKTGEITDEINTLLNFQKKLKKLGHYKTNYKNIDDLKYKFKMQLEKVLPNL